MRKYRSQANYDSADSECREMKNNIVFYKIKTEEAKGALEEPKLRSVEPGAPLSSVSFSLRSGPGSVDEDSP